VIRAVISDFGGVLTSPLVQAFAVQQEKLGLSMEEIGVAMARIADADGRNPLFELETGRMTEQEFLDRIGGEIGAELPSFGETFADIDRNEPLIDYMRRLRGRGMRTALLTNNVREWEPHWRAMLPEVDEIFEVIVDSAFVGMRKPDPEIYLLTVERLGGGLRPEECLFLDDIELNCQAARALGMTAVHFVSNDQALAEMDAALREAAA
jgi:putative hydrolase of the HAD superfamily